MSMPTRNKSKMRYDSGDRHASESNGSLILVYAKEEEHVRIDVFGFDGLAKTLSETQQLLDQLGFAVADAMTKQLRQPDVAKGELFLPHEQARWDRFAERWERLGEELRYLEKEQRTLFTVAFTRALQEGKWVLKMWGGGLCAVPADPKTEALLTKLAKEARLVHWNETLFIGAGGRGLHVEFNDREVAVRLEFLDLSPENAQSFAEALPMHLDLEAWRAERHKEMAENFDRQIVNLVKQRVAVTDRKISEFPGEPSTREEELLQRCQAYVLLIARRQEREQDLLQKIAAMEAGTTPPSEEGS